MNPGVKESFPFSGREMMNRKLLHIVFLVCHYNRNHGFMGEMMNHGSGKTGFFFILFLFLAIFPCKIDQETTRKYVTELSG